MMPLFPNCPLSKSFKQRLALFAAFAVTVFFILFIPVAVLPGLNAELKFHNDTINYRYLPDIQDDSARIVIDSLLSKRSLLNAKLLSSQSDSVVCVINLADSTLSLLLKGVPVFESKFIAYHKSPIFKKYSNASLAEWSAYPFTVSRSISSITKLPIIYRRAPKDTAEAALQQSSLELFEEREETWFSLYTDRNLEIQMGQDESKSFNSFLHRNKFFSNVRRNNYKRKLSALKEFNIPEYVSYIKIITTASDARVIYRALPENALIVLKF
jgi:hypothetical protein